VVDDYINTMKTAFDLNFDSKQAVKQQRHTHINIEVKRSCQLKSFSLYLVNVLLEKSLVKKIKLFHLLIY